MRLPELATRYPVTVAMGTVAIVLLGWISVGGLGTDLLPTLDTPVITVDLRAPGKSPREMEERYTRRLERDISTLSGVRRVYSVTRAGQSVVVAEFAWNTDMDFALLDVQKRTGAYAVDEDVETLDVVQEDPQALPVARIAITPTDDADLDALLGTIETVVKPKLEALDGVASAQIEGDAEKEIRVTLDPYMLEAFDLTVDAIVQRIQAANEDVSGGTLEENDLSYQVKGLARLRSVEDVAALIVGERVVGATTGAGATGTATGAAGATGTGTSAAGETRRVPVRLGEVGRVQLEYQERETIVRLDGVECLGMAIYKEADASTVDVVEETLATLDDLALDLPVVFTTVENQAAFIQQAVQEVQEAAIYGAILAVVVLFLFLRSATVTLVVSLAIPISILATFTLMYFQDLTLNVMTLGGLALGAGMLVDNAIVVIENIFRHLERGADPTTAASRGAGEVGTAILASTLTTVSVFVPIVYLQGLVGELFKEQAWTVTYSLVSSLVIALTVVPALASRVLRRPESVVAEPTEGRYARALRGALRRKGLVVLMTLVVLAATVAAARTIRAEFIPREGQGLLHLELSLPESTALGMTDRVTSRVTDIVRQIGGDDIATLYARSGVDPTQVASIGDPTGPNRSTISVALQPGRGRDLGRLVEAIDTHLADIPDLDVKYRLHETALEGVMGDRGAPIEVAITGDDLDTLSRLTEELRSRIDALPSVYNVRTSFQGGRPEIDLQLREDVAAAFGLTPQAMATALEQRLSGAVAGELARDQRSRTIRVGFERAALGDLRSIRIDTADGAMLTLGDLAEPTIVQGPREILRDGQRRVGRVSGYVVEGRALGEAAAEVAATLDDLALPSGYRVEVGGEERERAESFRSLGFALGLSVLLVYMVMASLFESLVHPFTVMLTVPLAGVGVVFGFWALNEPLSVMAYIGIIMLGGIAVNDAIILVDRINQLRDSAESVREAVVAAAQDRLRPILMTSATTVLALLPMAIGLGEGARLRAPMAIAVIGGLVTSTLMTLVMIPVAYELVDAVRRPWRRVADGAAGTDR